MLAFPGEPLRQAETLGAPLVRSNHTPLHYRLLVSDESLDPALTAHSHTPRHCRVSRHYFTRLVVTHTRSSHIQSTAVARPRYRETQQRHRGLPARHPTVSRPRARLPTYLLLASYGAIGRSEWWWLHRGMQHVPARARRRARSRAAQISPPARRPAAAPACGGLIIR